jgi:hypothetical protein
MRVVFDVLIVTPFILALTLFAFAIFGFVTHRIS